MIVKRQVVPPVLGNAQPGSTAPNTLSEASIASGLATSASTSSTDCATPSSAPANKGGSAPLVSILIPVVLFVFLLVLGGTLICLRQRLAACLRWRPLARTRTTHSLTAEQLLSASNGEGPGPVTSRTDARRGGRGPGAGGQRARVPRRTESGHSLRTLPEYNKDAGDDEMVLTRVRSDSPGADLEDVAPSPSRMTQLGPAVSIIPATGVPRGIAVSDARPTGSSPSPTPEAESASAPPPRRFSLAIHPPARRGWGEVPSYDETLSAPLPARRYEPSPVPNPPSSAVSLPRPTSPPAAPPRNGRLLALLTRNRLALGRHPHTASSFGSHAGSATSLLLQPTTSRFSTTSGAPSGIGSPWASTHSLVISSPLPHSAVRASWGQDTWPRNGLSDEQRRFLSSTEAVTLAGVQVDGLPRMTGEQGGPGRTVDGEQHVGQDADGSRG